METEKMAQQIVVEAPPQMGQLGAIRANNLIGTELGSHLDAVKAAYLPTLETMVNDQGLVRMKFVDDEAPYMAGSIAGLQPDVAVLMLAYERAAPCDENGEFLPLRAVKRKSEAPKASYSVEIPPNWEELHHLQRVRLAKELAGLNQTEMVDLKRADEIIREEAERRHH
jgi:hypothetical protein